MTSSILDASEKSVASLGRTEYQTLLYLKVARQKALKLCSSRASTDGLDILLAWRKTEYQRHSSTGSWLVVSVHEEVSTKDVLKDNLKACDIPIETWERQALNRPEWRTACRVGVERFERCRIEQLKETCIARHAAQNQSVPNTHYVCPDCQCHCRLRIGLISHRRKHATLLN